MRKNCIYATACLGLLLLLIGMILSLVNVNQFYIAEVSKRIVLRTDSEAMKQWQNIPFPALFKVYLWNVTNPAEVSAGAKPKVTEIGPYVYELVREMINLILIRQWIEKVNVKEEENDTLSYSESSRMYFSEKLSGNLRETDEVTIVHLPVVGMIIQVNDMMPEFLSYLESVWSALFPGMVDIFLRGTVRDILFEGIAIDCSSKDFMVTTVCNTMEENLPKTIRKVGSKEFKFSFFNYKTQVGRDVLRVYRGIENIKNLGKIFSFNSIRSMQKWKNRYCDMLNGTDGSHLPINLSPKDVVYLFQPDICRSVYARFEKEVFKGSTRLLRFVNTPDLFASSDENPDNHCFCAPKMPVPDMMGIESEEENETDAAVQSRTCLRSGALLLTPCLGAPVVLTFPHFYMADNSFFEYVTLYPEKELHQTFVDVEPLSGMPFNGSKRIQFNVEVKPITDVAIMANLTPGLFPVLWVEEHMELAPQYSSQIETLLIITTYMNVFGYVIIVVAAAFIMIAWAFHSKKNKTGSSDANDLGGYIGVHGLHRHQSKLPYDMVENDHLPSNPIRSSLRASNYPVFLAERHNRIFSSSINSTSENFM